MTDEQRAEFEAHREPARDAGERAEYWVKQGNRERAEHWLMQVAAELDAALQAIGSTKRIRVEEHDQ